ncbi:MAG: hypothetical protein R2851_26025 [Caldilineaceae bacterium]
MTTHVFDLARFGWGAALPATAYARHVLGDGRAGALFAGLAAHAIRPLEQTLTASFGLVLGNAGHRRGWPLPWQGGSRAIAQAMTRYLQALGGDIVCGWTVTSLAELPPARRVLLDVTPPVPPTRR